MDALLLNEIKRNITIALQEDQVNQDLTSQSCFPKFSQANAELILKQDAVIAGLIFLPLICHAIDSKIECILHKDDGMHAMKGDLLATLKGSIQSLLALERTTINFIQHATSIATQTYVYVKAIEGFNCAILDTRKTLPGHRFLQKYAVSMGGGKNHRFHLADKILIKDNHLAHLKIECEFPIQESIKRARKHCPEKTVQIEVTSLEELQEALKASPDSILLDNMPPLEVKKASHLCPKEIYLEASGNIDLTNIVSYAETGVNGISIGRLTHSIQAVDMSLKI